MNNRPVVAPGVFIGVVVLLLMMIFVALPQDTSEKSAAKLSDAQLLQMQICRQWPEAADGMGLTPALASLEKSVASGTAPDSTVQQQVATAAQQSQQVLSQVAQMPDLGKLSAEFAGLAETMTSLSQPLESAGAAGTALRAAQTHTRNIDSLCSDIDVAVTRVAS